MSLVGVGQVEHLEPLVCVWTPRVSQKDSKFQKFKSQQLWRLFSAGTSRAFVLEKELLSSKTRGGVQILWLGILNSDH